MELSFKTGIPKSRSNGTIESISVNRQETSNASAEEVPFTRCLFLRKGNAFVRVEINDIILLEADRNYTTIHTKDDTYIYSIILKKIEEKLPQSCFLRVHRSYLINITAITGFEGNLLHIGNLRVPVSRTYRMHVFSLFKTI